MRHVLAAIALLVITACAEAKPTAVTVHNSTAVATTVYVAFGADSKVLPPAWALFCTAQGALNCTFPLAAGASQALPAAGYLNATLSFGAAVGCGSTKAELNLNNPKWFDVADVSLVDGYSNKVAIVANGTRLGPPLGSSGNEKVYGLFPLGCDICTGREHPPCGMKPGGAGCKAGSQYKPDVPCQYQGPKKGGGGKVEVLLEG